MLNEKHKKCLGKTPQIVTVKEDNINNICFLCRQDFAWVDSHKCSRWVIQFSNNLVAKST